MTFIVTATNQATGAKHTASEPIITRRQADMTVALYQEYANGPQAIIGWNKYQYSVMEYQE